MVSPSVMVTSGIATPIFGTAVASCTTTAPLTDMNTSGSSAARGHLTWD